MNIKAKTNKNKLCHRYLSIFLCIILLLSGCSYSGLPIESLPETTSNNPDFDTQTASQKEFDDLLDDILKLQLETDQLNYHYLVKNPNSFNLTTPSNPYPLITLDYLKSQSNTLDELKKQLNSFDNRLLKKEQLLSLQILNSILETESLSRGLELYYQPLAPTIGVQAQLPILLSEYRIESISDIESYFTLLSEIDTYFQELLDWEILRAQSGLAPNDLYFNHLIESCESYIFPTEDNFLNDSFKMRIQMIEELSAEQQTLYTEAHANLISSDFIPAYQLLVTGLTELKGSGTNTLGLSGFPQGKEYYEYLVLSGTGTSYHTVDELLAAMETQLNDDLLHVSAITQEYPDLIADMYDYEFRQSEFTAMVDELKFIIQKDFPTLTQTSEILKEVPNGLQLSLSPAFYLTPPIDDSNNNTVYMNTHERFNASNHYITLAHESYPGHLYQTVYFRNSGAHPIRQLFANTGYQEGWATYAEYYIYTADNGLDPKLGELLAANAVASLGLQACLDVYINYLGWDKEQVQTYLSTSYNNSEALANLVYQTMIEAPGNYLNYYVGYMEIQDMRENAELTLKDSFELKEFHRFLLDVGPAPFDVINNEFETWLATQ